MKCFKPHVDYIPEGDMLECYWNNADYYADHVDEHITIYRDRTNEMAVGVAITGCKDMIRKSEDINGLDK